MKNDNVVENKVVGESEKVKVAWSVERSVQWLREWFGSFDFVDEESAKNFLCAFISMKVGEKVRGRRPCFVFSSSQPGAGKSLLAKACLYAGVGEVENFRAGGNKEVMKTLDSVLMMRALNGNGGVVPQACFFDDYRGTLKGLFNNYLDSDSVTQRVMGTQRMIECENELSIFVTGSHVKVSDDVLRRVNFIGLGEPASDYDRPLEDVVMGRPWWQADAHAVIACIMSHLRLDFEDGIVKVHCEAVVRLFAESAGCSVLDIFKGESYSRSMAPEDGVDEVFERLMKSHGSLAAKPVRLVGIDEVERVAADQAAAFGSVELMIDIETLATVADAVVTEIGAVMFDGVSGEILEEFSYECDVDGQLKDGRRVSASTLKWYQDNQLAISGLDADEALSLGNVISLLNEWVTTYCEREQVDQQSLKVWAKGGMDCAVLDHAGAEMGYELPWRYGRVRDLRSVIEESDVELEKVHVPHEGLADCKIQVKQLMAVRAAGVAARTNGSDRTDAWMEKLKLTNQAVVDMQERVNSQEDRHDAQWCALRSEVENALSSAEEFSRHSLGGEEMVTAFKSVLLMMEKANPNKS